MGRKISCKERDTQAQREDGHVKMEAKVGVVLPQGKAHRGYRKSEEATKYSSLESRGGMVLLTP